GIPMLEELEPEYCYLKWDVTLHSDCDKAAIDDVFMFVQDELKLTLTPLEAHAEAPAPAPAFQIELAEAEPVVEVAPVVETAPAPVQAKEPVAKEVAAKEATAAADQRRDEPKRAENIATVRVQAERLDELMDRVGELVIAQARLTQLASSGSDLSIKMIAE